MSEIIKPSVQAFLVCDQVIEDSVTKKKSLIGLFTHLQALNFPFQHQQMGLYFCLTDAEGLYRFDIDLIYLNKYDCIEVLNPYGSSISYWDAALSAGKPVFIMGNDDAHHVEKIASIGKDCTWVNIDALNCKSIVKALKTGRSYGMHIADVPCETEANRIKRLRDDLPRLKEFSVSHDTIQMALSQKAVEIQFTGQKGKILSTTCQVSQARYVIKSGDRYVRATIIFADGTEIFLSPVFRYSVSPFAETSGPVINRTKTILYFLTGLLILSAWGLIVANSLFGNLVRRIRLAQKRRPAYPAVG